MNPFFLSCIGGRGGGGGGGEEVFFIITCRNAQAGHFCTVFVFVRTIGGSPRTSRGTSAGPVYRTSSLFQILAPVLLLMAR